MQITKIRCLLEFKGISLELVRKRRRYHRSGRKDSPYICNPVHGGTYQAILPIDRSGIDCAQSQQVLDLLFGV
ncbi:MAG: hypothetical protein LKE40_11235 [Spirochaetia bacterium]|nr:hypothetical protein [Spirochaetia bacterium]